MAISTKTKPKTTPHKKRTAQHHRQTKHYIRSYWPYLPMLVIIAGGIFANSLLNRQQAVLGAKTNLTASSLLQATNDDRLQHQALALSLDDQLQQAAQAKANDMVQRNYWSHITPSGQQPWGFVTATGYQYQTAGENLAYGFNSAPTIMKAWLQSPKHRENLLSDDFSQVGFGVAQSADYLGKGSQTVVVALYALPTSAGSSVPIATQTPEDAQPVSRAQAVVGSVASGFIVGIVGTLAVIIVLVRHGFAWRKLLNRGEMFVIEHPLVDTTLVTLAVIAVLLNHTTGFIR